MSIKQQLDNTNRPLLPLWFGPIYETNSLPFFYHFFIFSFFHFTLITLAHTNTSVTSSRDLLCLCFTEMSNNSKYNLYKSYVHINYILTRQHGLNQKQTKSTANRTDISPKASYSAIFHHHYHLLEYEFY